MDEESVSLGSHCLVHLTHNALVFIKCAFCSNTIWTHAILIAQYLSQKAHRQSHSKVNYFGITNKTLHCDEKPVIKNRGPTL